MKRLTTRPFHRWQFRLVTIPLIVVPMLIWAMPGSAQESWEIVLLSRSFTPDPGVQPQLVQLGAVRAHVLVQFEALPDPGDRKVLAADGLELLDYVGASTYIARLERADTAGQFLNRGVRWIGRLEAADRLHPSLAAGRIDDWATRPGGTVRVRVVLFPGTPAAEARALMTRFAADSSSVAVPDPVVPDQMERPVLDRGGNVWSITVPLARVGEIAALEMVKLVTQEPPPLEPINDRTRNSIRTEQVQGGPPPSYGGLTGQGIQVGVMDSGIEQTHGDLTGRVLASNMVFLSHGTHVAGTIAASGARSHTQGGAPFQWRGHAPRADVVGYVFSWDRADFDDAIDTHGADATNHSHTQTPPPDYGAGTRSVDRVIWDRNLYVATAAGNNGISPNNGSPLLGYFSLTGSKAKNPLTVGNFNAASGIRWRGSSMGPTFDGRLKPDVVAPGTGIRSTMPGNTYGINTGTSMASPAVAGVMALMLENYFAAFGTTTRPLNSTMKAVLIHTATDQVQIPARPGEPANVDTGVPVVYHAGPDWATGYGLINAQEATRIIADPAAYTEGVTAGTGAQTTHAVTVQPGRDELKVTLVWDDFPGSDQTPNTQPKLVNDLDLVLEAPDGTVHRPWVLPPLTPESPGSGMPYTGTDPIAPGDIVAAAPGVDRLNNVEQVGVASPAAGTWQARVSGFSVPMGPQRYSLVAAEVAAATTTTPSRWSLSIHAGVNSPQGSAGNALDPGASLGFDLEYAFDATWAAELFVGIDDFPGQAGAPDVTARHYVVNGKAYFLPGPTRVFLNLGLGAYDFDPGSTEFGFNGGAGAQLNVTPIYAVELCGKYHRAFVSPSDFEFLTLHAGVRWRF